MCGRFTLRAPASVIAEAFALLEVPPLTPRFNIAPSQLVAAVRETPQSASPTQQFAWLRWGLIPSWARDPAIGNRMINARSESVSEKPAYRTALRRRRCLLVADGFYEWQKSGRRRQPYFFRLHQDRPFAFAGLWESWEGPDHSLIESCTLLTTTANALVQPIHDRMPVILGPEHYDRWLDPAIERAESLLPLLAPFPSEAMEAYPVGLQVNSPAHDDATCIEGLAD
jgi:putative SOS response-associated peptidase YedK